MLRALALSLFCLACGRTSESSQVQSMIDRNDLEFMTQSQTEADKNARSMGTLVSLVAFEDEVFATPYCSAVRISSRHILSAAHCFKEGEALAFDSLYLAADGEENSYSFKAMGKSLRLAFTGLPIDAYLSQKRSLRDALPTPVHVDRSHDFVVWELPLAIDAKDHIDWTQISSDPTRLTLYAYPQGAPLAKASDCGGIWQKGVLRHDCDSMPGSSGGLVVDANGGAVALHTTGSADNLWSIFGPRQAFESLDELSARLEQSSRPISAWECDAETNIEIRQNCIVSGGRNRALGLGFIRDTLASEAPELAKRIELAQNEKKAADIDDAADPELQTDADKENACQSARD